MNNSTRSALWSILVAMVSIRSGLAAETLDRLVAGAKKESELTFIAGAQTFGGPKTLAALEAAFNKRFGRQYGRRRAEKFGHTSDAELRKKVSNLIRRTNWWTCFMPIIDMRWFVKGRLSFRGATEKSSRKDLSRDDSLTLEAGENWPVLQVSAV